MLSEPILVVARIVQSFDTLGIPYVVGGSLASSVYGIPRATQDVDLVADLIVSHAEKLQQLLADDFYVDSDMIRDAVLKRASFNVIHLATMFKADVFVMKRDAWSREEMSRARQEQLDGPSGPVNIRFASPEDTLLHKLVWYRLGNDNGLTSSACSRSRASCWRTTTSTGGLPCWESQTCFPGHGISNKLHTTDAAELRVCS